MAMLNKRKTKKQILAEGGYIAPKAGRPQLYGEPTVAIAFRIPESLAERLGQDRNGRAREVVVKWLEK